MTETRRVPDPLGCAILVAFRDALRAAAPDLGFRLTLFGSRARGDAEPESDVDLLVELDVPKLGRATHALLSDIATRLSLAHGIVVSLLVLDAERAASREGFPFLRAIREEGVAA
jgi:predicted nucleotidyltransferase